MFKIEKTIVESNLDIDHLAAKMIDLALTAKFVLNPVLHMSDLADWCHKWRIEIQSSYRWYLTGCKYLVFVEYGMNDFDFWWATKEEFDDPIHSRIGDKYRQLGVLKDEEAEDKHEESDEYV